MSQTNFVTFVGNQVVANERLYLTADDRVVGEGDPDAAFLLAGPGSVIDRVEVERLGLTPEPAPPTASIDKEKRPIAPGDPVKEK